MKFAKTLKSTNSLISTINQMTPAASLVKMEPVEVKKDATMNKTAKDMKEEEYVYKDKNMKLSSYGYHYWDATVMPSDKDSFWPPLTDRWKMKKIKSVPDMTLTSKRQDILEWNKHN